MTEGTTTRPPRYLSGIQPSGHIHLGNYFGALRQHIDNQPPGNAFYFIPNYHALTTLRDGPVLRQNTFDAACVYLACGIDPERSVFFRQSDVPEVCELTWLLLTVTGMGELERATSYKDKVAKGIIPSAGLFTYPVLMAADILAYDATHVPVGKDQVQHVEMTREMARAFNSAYAQDVFTIPEVVISPAAKVPGIDGEKMSKSYGNHIPIMLTGKPLKKLVMSIKTDSTPMEEPKNPASCTVYELYSLFGSEAEQAELAARYRQGGMGYGDAKTLLLAKIEEHFAPARARYAELQADPDFVEDILQEGGRKAREVAREVTDRARRACGLA